MNFSELNPFKFGKLQSNRSLTVYLHLNLFNYTYVYLYHTLGLPTQFKQRRSSFGSVYASDICELLSL